MSTSSSSSSKSLPTVDEKALHHHHEKGQQRVDAFSSETADACLDWVIFPLLLFIQFGATMYCQMEEGGVLPRLDWKTVHMTVFTFCLVAGIYRQIMRRHTRWCSLVRLLLLLLPEIFTNILLAMVMFTSLSMAYTALTILALLLSLIGIVAGVDLLWNMDTQRASAEVIMMKFDDDDEACYLRLIEEEESNDDDEEDGAFVC
jgi:hypothetical protein